MLGVSPQRDDRRELAHWIQQNIPPDSALAHDVRVLLARAKDAGLADFVLPNPIFTPPDRYVADLGSVEELRSKGVTHVAVCEADYHNTEKQKSDKMKARAQWYANLFAHHRLVWETRPGPVAYLQPGIRLYELNALGSSPLVGAAADAGETTQAKRRTF